MDHSQSFGVNDLNHASQYGINMQAQQQQQQQQQPSQRHLHQRHPSLVRWTTQPISAYQLVSLEGGGGGDGGGGSGNSEPTALSTDATADATTATAASCTLRVSAEFAKHANAAWDTADTHVANVTAATHAVHATHVAHHAADANDACREWLESHPPPSVVQQRQLLPAIAATVPVILECAGPTTATGTADATTVPGVLPAAAADPTAPPPASALAVHTSHV
ncbi:uncharacterized protein SPSK_04546 [Sporothrix schenckii 1099-18]|uniref:Uncharacterized protein n=1 Tax=Sporothrix schenckii 1099-18 TaxID=1397361 RepID=A0A0F2M1H4_SPOSC|nr:uncharacterized protein SPSK_04546 [Sporothrix schenckii 1099-18]KJR83562.1 hypothetical protein SPSK_04546 [Sporothrix schenckii 1099-18]